MRGIGGKGVVALSLVLGVATSYMVHNYVDQVSQAAKPVETVAVVTAAKDIPARTTITSEMVQVAQVPVDLKLPQAVATPAQVTGKVTKLPISKGEEVLVNKIFADREESGLAFVVPDGKRAVSVGVTEVVGSGGMLIPGDFVDVVAVVDTAAPNGSADSKDPRANAAAQIKSISQYILQNVEVLAVAQRMEGDVAPPNTAEKAAQTIAPGDRSKPQKQSTAPQPSAHTVTLAVEPEDAQKLVLAEAKGQIRLVLRAHGDQSTIKLGDGLFGSLDGAAILKTEPKPLADGLAGSSSGSAVQNPAPQPPSNLAVQKPGPKPV